MTPVQPLTADEFEIILLLKPEKEYTGPATLALVECGYKNGLEEGMVGVLIKPTDTSETVIPAFDMLDVEVQDVTAYESACLIRGAEREEIESGSIVTFDIPQLASQELRERAGEALAVEKYRRAAHYFEELTRVDSLDADSSVQQLLAHCRQEVEREDNRKLTRKEKKVEKKRAGIYHKLGAYFFNNDNYDAARHYLERAVRADERRKHAKHLLCIIEDGVPCDFPEPAGFAAVETPPEMIYLHPLEYPEEAKRAGVTGLVWVKALVDKSGIVLKTSVAESSGWMALDRAATEAAYFNRFQPGMQKGKPVFCWVMYKVDFVLD
ncbi:MAG: energy transducer TonB [candidate division Zixibacteria bacterium]|nr:energy transducer TonB [candidate division Zixibacteria bacterium]MDH3936712.1 energy transducer TonB [candidate division Zixibacteria bacterium]MDH4032565.1 energy transducer TonB [candidate division Zixibacteria bacterium]